MREAECQPLGAPLPPHPTPGPPAPGHHGPPGPHEMTLADLDLPEPLQLPPLPTKTEGQVSDVYIDRVTLLLHWVSKACDLCCMCPASGDFCRLSDCRCYGVVKIGIILSAGSAPRLHIPVVSCCFCMCAWDACTTSILNLNESSWLHISNSAQTFKALLCHIPNYWR